MFAVFKKILSFTVATAIAVTSLAAIAFADEETTEACPVTVSATWGNFTIANVSFTVNAEKTLNGIPVSELTNVRTTVVLSDYFTKSQGSLASSASSFSCVLKLLDNALGMTVIPLFKTITVSGTTSDGVKLSQTYQVNDTITLPSIGHFNASAAWTSGSEARVDFASVSNAVIANNEAIANYTNVTFTGVLSEYFQYVKDGGFAGLRNVGNGKDNKTVTWSFNPSANKTNNYSLAGNGVWFTVKQIQNAAFVDGMLPVFSSITVTGTNASGVVCSTTIGSPYLTISDVTTNKTAEWTDKAVVSASASIDFSAYSGGKINEGACTVEIFYDKTNFTDNSDGTATLNPGFEKNSDGKINVGTYTATASFTDGTTVSKNYDLPAVAVPTVTATFIDGDSTTNQIVEIYSEINAPAALSAGFYGWTTDYVNRISFPCTISDDTTFFANYVVVIDTPEEPEEVVEIPDEETPAAETPDETPELVEIEDEESAKDQTPTDTAEPAKETNAATGDAGVAGIAVVIAAAATTAAVISRKKK